MVNYIKSIERLPDNEIADIVFELLCFLARRSKGEEDYWSNGEEILCRYEDQAEIIADFLETCGCDSVRTGYYDPAEDAREGRTFEDTGWYYVDID